MAITKNIGKYILYGGIAILVIGGILFLTTSKASAETTNMPTPGTEGSGETNTGSQNTSTTSTNKTSGPIIITNHDSVWDYKLDNGVWYTKKKTSSTWLDMKSHLSADDYQKSIQELTNFMNKSK